MNNQKFKLGDTVKTSYGVGEVIAIGRLCVEPSYVISYPDGAIYEAREINATIADDQ